MYIREFLENIEAMFLGTGMHIDRDTIIQIFNHTLMCYLSRMG